MTYEMRLPPRVCQSEALNKMFDRKAFALHMAMRTGKTKVIIDDFGRMENNDMVDDLLVIATGGSYRTWETALQEHAPLSLLARMQIFVWDSRKGRTVTKQNELAQFQRAANTERPRCFIINIEALSSVKPAKEAC